MIAVDVQPNLPARIPYGDVRLGVLVARRQWPASPCNGHEQVQYGWTVPRWAREAEQAVRADGRQLMGAANLDGRRCLIWISSAATRSDVCKLAVHELGHWAGEEHTDRGPMAVDLLDDDYTPCNVPR